MTACLKTLELVEIVQETPMGTLSIGLVMMARMSSMSSSHIVTDDATGLMYLDTVTISIGRIILCELDPDTSMGPIIEDITG